jgi:hypothetical protein
VKKLQSELLNVEFRKEHDVIKDQYDKERQICNAAKMIS